MKRMIFGYLIGIESGYLLWTPRGKELVDRALNRSPSEFVDVAVVGTVPAEPAPSNFEHMRATS
jgi:hypothetical protein